MVVNKTEAATRHFRLLQMPCCSRQVEWIDPRMPNNCPECGESVFSQLTTGEHTLFEDAACGLVLHA